jgi:hypothetical protein
MFAILFCTLRFPGDFCFSTLPVSLNLIKLTNQLVLQNSLVHMAKTVLHIYNSLECGKPDDTLGFLLNG